MPYIAQARRQALARGEPMENAADLCYWLCMEMLHGYHSTHEAWRAFFHAKFMEFSEGREQRWQVYCDIMGAVSGAILETDRQGWPQDHLESLGDALTTFYDAVIGPYEDLKIISNGGLQ